MKRVEIVPRLDFERSPLEDPVTVNVKWSNLTKE